MGFSGNLGEPKASSGTEHRERGWYRLEQHPGVGAAISPQRRAKAGNQPEVLRRNATNGATRDKPGSRSCLI